MLITSNNITEATSTVLGGVELFSDTSQTVAANAVTATVSRTYGVQLNADKQAVVNVPWVDTDTNTYPTTYTWTAGTTAGPTGSLTGTMTAVSFGAIPEASATNSGIVTTGAQTFAGTKTFVAPVLGTPTSGNLANCTFPTLNQNTTGRAGSSGLLYDDAFRRITNPIGGFYNGASVVTGALAINFPVGMADTMLHLTVKIYEYTTNESFELNCGGYLYGTGNTWANNPFAYIVGNPGVDRRFTIRFGYTAGGKAVIYIGELAATWSYPQVFITEVKCGFNGASATWTTGWSISAQATAFENVTATITNSQVGYALSTNTANTSVLRDGSGNFSAGTITAALSGNATTATTASHLSGAQWGIPYQSALNTTSFLGVGTATQILTSNGASAPTWTSFDLGTHASDSSYKKICRVATTADISPSTFSANILSGYSQAPAALALTTTAASTTITTTSTATIKVGAGVSVATVQVAAGTYVASIVSGTSFTVTNRANITTTAITGNGTTATATFGTQTYAPYAVGSTIVISGTTPATYSGSKVVTACTTTTVSFASTETVTATVQGAIAFTIAAGTSISTSFTQTIAALPAIDGITLVANDRVLIKDSRTLGGIVVVDAAKYNGIYYVSNVGSTSVPWTLTRAADADASTDLDGAIVNISVGTANFGKSYKTRFSGTDTLNTTEMYWSRLVDITSSSLAPIPTTAVGVDIATDTETVMYKVGAVTDYAVNSIGVKTLQATGASAYTRASSMYIAGAPVASTNVTITAPYSLYVAGGVSRFDGEVITPNININRELNVGSGISWYNTTFNAWIDYMGPPAVAGQGPNAVITPAAGTLVTSWAKRSFIENSTGYGWIFESGLSGATTPTVVAEIRSSDGAAKFNGSITTGGTLGVTGTTITAGTFNASATTPVGSTRLNYEGYFYPTYLNLAGSADTATAATHYFVEQSTDGFIRPKTLANVKTEIVTSAAIVTALGYTPAPSTTALDDAIAMSIALG